MGLHFNYLLKLSFGVGWVYTYSYVVQIIYPHLMVSVFHEHLYDLAHVAGWKPYDLHDLAHVSRVDLYSACTDPAQRLV